MPELPEVETIRKQLAKEIGGFTIVGVRTDWEKSFRPDFKSVSPIIVGKKIKSIRRQAKLLVFDLSDDHYLLFHLKLTGRLLVRRPGDPADDYTRSVFSLTKGQTKKELRFADARKFGFVKIVSRPEEMEALLKGYGPEPFKDLKLKNFIQVLKSSTRPVKLVLLDQSKISGIGNIYANDALWLARINPRMASNKLTKQQSEKLYQAVLAVLKKGLKYGGASDQWYRQVHGEEGQYQEHFLVYGKTKEKCRRCGTPIERIEIGGRGTFICPKCQKVK